MVGGVTYEEAKEIELFKKEFVMPTGPSLAMGGQINIPDIYLGGTFIHNSKTFLAEVSQLREKT